MSGFEFTGTFTHSLDAKGRLILPARFRAPFDPHVYLTPHHDNCLALWTPEDFSAQKTARAETENRSSADRQRFRFWTSRVEKIQMDSQGRVPISSGLRDLAQLSGETMVVGVDNRVEIWNPARWREIVESVADPDATDPAGAEEE